MRKRMIIPRHEQKDGGLVSDEGVTELIFARGTGPGRSPFMAQPDGSDRLAAVRSWRRRTDQTDLPQSVHGVCAQSCHALLAAAPSLSAQAEEAD